MAKKDKELDTPMPPPAEVNMSEEMQVALTRQFRITQLLKEQIASVVMANTEQAAMLEEKDGIITRLREELHQLRGEADATA